MTGMTKNAITAFLISLIVTVTVAVSSVEAETGKDHGRVWASIFCEPGSLEAFTALIDEGQHDRAGMLIDRMVQQTGECLLTPTRVQLPVESVVSGPHVDFEGDPFFILEVGGDESTGALKLHVLGWPGHNYERIEPAGYSI